MKRSSNLNKINQLKKNIGYISKSNDKGFLKKLNSQIDLLSFEDCFIGFNYDHFENINIIQFSFIKSFEFIEINIFQIILSKLIISNKINMMNYVDFILPIIQLASDCNKLDLLKGFLEGVSLSGANLQAIIHQMIEKVSDFNIKNIEKKFLDIEEVDTVTSIMNCTREELIEQNKELEEKIEKLSIDMTKQNERIEAILNQVSSKDNEIETLKSNLSKSIVKMQGMYHEINKLRDTLHDAFDDFVLL